MKGQPPIKMVLVGAQRGDFSSMGHGGLDREFQRETHELERNLKSGRNTRSLTGDVFELSDHFRRIMVFDRSQLKLK